MLDFSRCHALMYFISQTGYFPRSRSCNHSSVYGYLFYILLTSGSYQDELLSLSFLGYCLDECCIWLFFYHFTPSLIVMLYAQPSYLPIISDLSFCLGATSRAFSAFS